MEQDTRAACKQMKEIRRKWRFGSNAFQCSFVPIEIVQVM